MNMNHFCDIMVKAKFILVFMLFGILEIIAIKIWNSDQLVIIIIL